MNLIIKSKESKNLDIFIIDYVIPEIENFFNLNLNHYLLKNWDKYFQTKYPWRIEDTPKNTFDILIQGIKNLRLSNNGKNNYIITIDSNKLMPGTSAKLYDLCALINYGNLEMPPYPIFEKTFEQVASLVPSLFKEYKEEQDEEDD